MEWTKYKDGELGGCLHGHYFIYRKFREEIGAERWFAVYEAGKE
jgi:hypothetical protein